MLSYIIMSIKDMFKNIDTYANIDEYIVSHNPQDMCDVERLEREYTEMLERRYTNFYHE